MKQSVSSEAGTSSASEEIQRIFWNLKFTGAKRLNLFRARTIHSTP